MVDVLAAAVAAHVRNAAFVVVAGGHAGVAVGTGVVLAGTHEGSERGIGAFWGRGHAVEGIGLVGLIGLAGLVGAIGGVGRRVVFPLLEVVHC